MLGAGLAWPGTQPRHQSTVRSGLAVARLHQATGHVCRRLCCNDPSSIAAATKQRLKHLADKVGQYRKKKQIPASLVMTRLFVVTQNRRARRPKFKTAGFRLQSLKDGKAKAVVQRYLGRGGFFRPWCATEPHSSEKTYVGAESHLPQNSFPQAVKPVLLG